MNVEGIVVSLGTKCRSRDLLVHGMWTSNLARRSQIRVTIVGTRCWEDKRRSDVNRY